MGGERERGVRPALVGVLSSVLFLFGAIAGLPGASAQAGALTQAAAVTQAGALTQAGVSTQAGTAAELPAPTAVGAVVQVATAQVNAAAAISAVTAARSSGASRSAATTRSPSSRPAFLVGERRPGSPTRLTQQRLGLGGATGLSPLFAELAVSDWLRLTRPPAVVVPGTSSSVVVAGPSSAQSRAPPAQAVLV
jgi:hypothetical protein